MKILAIDWGVNKTGLAVGSTETKLALPFSVLKQANQSQLIQQLKKIIDDEEIELLLVGEPKTMAGGESQQTRLLHDFVNQLKLQLAVKVELMDERLTTKRSMAPSPLPTRSNDELAAMYLLQDYLDRYNLV
ncbi:MAG: Holliday junction resolvase RuvX [Patescibacteria group bacterium]